jgi:salicylate hydroxylase
VPNASPILIAGAGIAGLAAALALHKIGRRCRILEARADLVQDGAGIQIGPNGTAALSWLGVAEHVATFVSVPAAIRVLDGPTGRRLADLPLGAWMATRHASPYWVVHRADLHACLRAAVNAAGIDIETGTTVIEADDRGDRVDVVLADGRRIDAPALVAADGLWSTLRERMHPQCGPIPFGRWAARTVLAADALPSAELMRDVHIWLAPDRHVVTYPVRRDRELNVVVIAGAAAASKLWSTPVEAAEIARRTARLDPRLAAHLAVATTWHQWPLMSAVPLQTFVRGRIALLGDAAHPMLPFLAQGAVMALEGAIHLARAIASNADLENAFADYDRQHRPRATRVAGASARNGRLYHLQTPLAPLRNAILPLIPGRIVMSAYDWMYGEARTIAA